jgi:hypothetical protein
MSDCAGAQAFACSKQLMSSEMRTAGHKATHHAKIASAAG